MNIVNNLDQYNENNIFFCDPIKNTIINRNVNNVIILYKDKIVVIYFLI